MNICLIGFGIPSLILANILANKNIKISIIDEGQTKSKFISRTIGITKNNIDYLEKEKIILGKLIILKYSMNRKPKRKY
jgi:UDP-glucose 6-dehydrogenase